VVLSSVTWRALPAVKAAVEEVLVAVARVPADSAAVAEAVPANTR